MQSNVSYPHEDESQAKQAGTALAPAATRRQLRPYRSWGSLVPRSLLPTATEPTSPCDIWAARTGAAPES